MATFQKRILSDEERNVNFRPRARHTRMPPSDEPARFCDETGEALNAAARAVVAEAIGADRARDDVSNDAAAKLGPVLRSVPIVKLELGTHKYVQVQLTHPDEPGTAILVVRSVDVRRCPYHADVYRALVDELGSDARTRGVIGRVIGGRAHQTRRRDRIGCDLWAFFTHPRFQRLIAGSLSTDR